MNVDIEIKSGVPIPPKYHRRGFVAALRKLKVGDCCLLTTDRNNVGSLVKCAGLTGKVTLRTEIEGVMVWRIA